VRGEIVKHIEKLAIIIEQLRSMGTIFDDALAFFFVASVEACDILLEMDAIKTLTNYDIKWEEVSSSFIEKVKKY